MTALAGVPFDLGHDAAWWRDWWARNRGEFPESVSRRPIPTVELPG